jgi:hypothetical protein
MMPEDGLAQLKPFNAIFFGAVGAPNVPDHITLWGLRLPICQGLDQYANVAHGSVIKALAMIVLGLLLGTIGQDVTSGTARFTMGFGELFASINFVSLAVGMFGVAEIFPNLEVEKTREVGVSKVTNLWLSKEEFRRIAGPVLHGTRTRASLMLKPCAILKSLFEAACFQDEASAAPPPHFRIVTRLRRSPRWAATRTSCR